MIAEIKHRVTRGEERGLPAVRSFVTHCLCSVINIENTIHRVTNPL